MGRLQSQRLHAESHLVRRQYASRFSLGNGHRRDQPCTGRKQQHSVSDRLGHQPDPDCQHDCAGEHAGRSPLQLASSSARAAVPARFMPSPATSPGCPETVAGYRHCVPGRSVHRGGVHLRRQQLRRAGRPSGRGGRGHESACPMFSALWPSPIRAPARRWARPRSCYTAAGQRDHGHRSCRVRAQRARKDPYNCGDDAPVRL